MMKGTQLTLSIGLRDPATFDNFEVLGQEALIHDLKKMSSFDGEQSFFLFGPQSSGKTHLLQAACLEIHRQGGQSHFISLYERGLSPDILEDLEQADLIALDDLDLIAQNAAWEEALFDFFNRARARGTRLIFSSSLPLQSLPIQLKDLHSRLSWGLVYGLKAYSDSEKETILMARAHQRGLDLPTSVAVFLLHHHSRNLGDLMHALDTLDKASLRLKRRISLPLVREVLS